MNNQIKHPKCRYTISIPEAFETIERESRSALVRKYGSQPDEAIVSRFNTELEMIKNNQFAEYYYIAHLIAKRCDELGYVHSLRGCGGSSLIAYLLGITEVNPLPAHYFCPKCGQVEYVDEYLFPFGADLNNREKECPRCGSKMIGDGQNSPWEFFMGLEGNKVPDFVFNVPSRKEIFEYLSERFGRDRIFNEARISDGNMWVHPGRIIIVPEGLDIRDFGKVLRLEELDGEEDQGPAVLLEDGYMFDHIDVFQNRVLNFIDRMQKRTGIHAKDINLRGIEIMDLLEYGDLESFPFECDYREIIKQIIDATNPTSYTELLKIYGNLHGAGVWKENNEILCRKYTLHQMIAFREDVMLDLIRWGVSHDIAFKIADKVRKGAINKHGFSNEEEWFLRRSEVPFWYIHSMEMIKYLFPKVHAVEYMTMYVRALWYKKHFYDDYLQVMQNKEPEMYRILAVQKVGD